ncbi:hypothetical protein [Komagataeibacter xylinus]|uniref:hypothetical protein n=1 Tax=Komagataeibacter xylinus TaxID=28448 RepID=UPI000AD12051|nr:hypothetical protein [Komagataeibacter xylinus]GBQ70721.1 hypothetical protein AA15237_0920 [Komagataeibacter xylinus NBRC 15237]
MTVTFESFFNRPSSGSVAFINLVKNKIASELNDGRFNTPDDRKDYIYQCSVLFESERIPMKCAISLWDRFKAEQLTEINS